MAAVTEPVGGTLGATSGVGARPDADSLARVRRAGAGAARRRRLVCLGLLAALVAAFALRVLGGDYTVTPPDLVRILRGEVIPGASFIVLESKLPRAVAGVLVGAAFGLAGALFQAVLRNPLASPDLIGISSGASAGAVVGIVLLGLTGPLVAVAGVVGALLTALAIAACAGGPGQRLILVGVAFSAGLVSLISYLFARANVFAAQDALIWLTGSLNQVTWPTIARLAVSVLLLVGATAALAPALRAADLGPDAATGLGLARGRTPALLLLGVLLTATATAATGPISFVALMSGPIARALNAGRTTLVGAALTGALLVVAGDHVAAYALPDANLPVGVVTGAVGAVLLIWLLVRSPGRNR